MSHACPTKRTRSSWTFRVREPQHSQKGFPRLTRSGVCGAGSTLLHNNLGGQGGRGSNTNSLLLGDCQGKKQDDMCSTAMGAFAPSTQSPNGSACLTVHLVARAQSSETSSTLRVPCA